jgi:hypothetical protein
VQNRTFITLSLKSTPLGTSDYQDGLIDFYGNSTPDGDGEKPLWTIHANPATNGTITVSIPGDLRGQWLNATWTRVDDWDYLAESVTSEFSNAILVGQ